jgi:hypothetical protein
VKNWSFSLLAGYYFARVFISPMRVDNFRKKYVNIIGAICLLAGSGQGYRAHNETLH